MNGELQSHHVWNSCLGFYICLSFSANSHVISSLKTYDTQCGKKSWRKYQLTCYYLNLQLSITRLDFMLFYTSEDLPFGSLLMAFVIVICVYQTKGFFLQNGGCKSPMRLVSIGVELIVSLSGTVRLNSSTCSCIAVKVHCLEWFKDLWLQVYKQTHGKYIQNNQVAIISSPKAPIQINLVPADLFFLINSSGGPWLAFTWFVTLWQKLVRCFFILYLHVTSLEKKSKS